MAGIYLHIPFCHSRCTYCDFYTVTSLNLIQDFTNALCAELEQRKNYLEHDEVKTVYFGGGTPSVLDAAQLNQIFSSIRKNYAVASNAEFTLEANPDDINQEYIEVLQKTSINRISMGVQSFDDEDLQFMNRRHSAEQGIKAVEQLRVAGFHNITIDLIYGLPKQSPQKWRKNLKQAFALPVQHLSCYHLTYEEGTPLYRLKQQKKVTPVIESVSNKMFEVLMEETAKAGFEHYEISNFALPGFYSKHNSAYWKGDTYLGVGPSAHSYNGTQRSWNKKGVAAYVKAMREEDSFLELENLSTLDKINEYIITRMRTIWGCDISEMHHLFPSKMVDTFLINTLKWQKSGEVEIIENVCRFSKKGIMISDAILAELILDNDS